MTIHHRIELDTDDVEAIERWSYSHKAIVDQAAQLLHQVKADRTVAGHEADQTAHTASLIQVHVRGGCDCPKGDPS